MAQAKSLPARPNLQYLKKLAKQRMRESGRARKLSAVQLDVAREYGFSSWRALKAHVDASIDSSDVTAFFKAIDQGDTKKVAKLLKARPSLAVSQDQQGRSPLHAAAETNAADIVQLLMKAGTDANAKFGESAHTALSWALTTMAWDAAAALVKGGVKPDLFCAAGLGDLEAVKSFFDRDGNLVANASQTGSSRFDEHGKRLPRPPTDPRDVISDALYIACRNARPEVARFLLEHDPDLKFKAFMRVGLLHWAHFGGSREVIDLLLKAGADPSERDPEYNCTPRAFGICVPCNWGINHLAISRLKEDPSLARINEGRGTPLHEAARGGHVYLAKLLLAVGADPAAKDTEGKTPADRARDAGHAEVVRLLGRSRQFKSAVVSKAKWQPIMDASFKGDASRVRKLLAAGADPNVVSGTQHRHRPLQRAIESKKTFPRTEKHEDVVRVLLEGGADPRLRGTLEKVTALQLAAIGETRFVPILRPHFEPLDIFHASAVLDEQRVSELLRNDKSLAKKPDENGWHAIHYVAASKVADREASVRITRMLLDAGADPNASWLFEGKWPLPVLYYACGRSNNPRVARILLEAGANPFDGESVYHASDEGHQECLDVIEQFVKPKPLAVECTKALANQIRWRRTRGMKWLLAHGADPTWKNPETGRSAIDEARKSKRSKQVMDALRANASK